MTTARALEQLRTEVDDLLAAHAETRGLADFAKYKGRPLDFMRDELGFVPYRKQIDVVESFLAHRRTAVRGCHGAGKDAILAPLMLYAAYVEGMLVIAISATERQLLGQLWREVRARFSTRLPGALYASDLRIGGDKRIIAMTSASVSNLTGWHDPKGVFIAISEAQGEQVEEAAFDAAIANAVDDLSRVVVGGNPIKAAGRFYEVSHKATWNAISISAYDHPNVIERRIVIPGGPAPSWPDEMAQEFGTESPWYVSRVLGEFPPPGSVDSLVKLEWLEAAYARHAKRSGLLRWPMPVVALDVARSLERDESVAAVIQGTRVHSLHAWHSRNLVDTTSRFLLVADQTAMTMFAVVRKRIVDTTSPTYGDAAKLHVWLSNMGAARPDLIVDSPGVGGGVVDVARSRGRRVIEYWGWSPADDPKRFANQRASVYWNLRSRLEDGTAELPRDPLLHGECLAMEWSQDSKGRIAMVPKEALRATLGRSPDRLDGVTIGLAHNSLRAPMVSFSTWND